MFFFSRRKKKKDHDNIEDVVEKGTDEENLKGEISGRREFTAREGHQRNQRAQIKI